MFLLVLAAMVCGRTCAMAFNRIVDRRFDALNPRTAGRHLPAGAISMGSAVSLCLLSGAGLVAASWALNPLCFALSPVALFFVCACLFWAGFEQAATTFNLFAQDYTDRSWLGNLFADGEHPAAWYQSANPIFVVIFAPVFAWMWVALGRRNLDPSSPAKFGLALVLVGIGFLVMMWAAQLVVSTGGKVAPTWLLLTYMLHTFGELCLSPVGLSNITKIAPKRYVGQMLGTWFLGSAVGNALAGLIGGHVGGAAAAEKIGRAHV